MNEMKPVAVVGLGAILPDAHDVPTFWEQLKNGYHAIRPVPQGRWDPALYYDPDPSVPDKTYTQIGAWVQGFSFEPLKLGIPIPLSVLNAMDDAQKWAIAAARQALDHYGYPQRSLNPERVAVILGNALAGEYHYRTSLRIHLPEFLAALSAVEDFQNLPASVQQALLGGFSRKLQSTIPAITEDTMPGELSNIIAGRVSNVFNFAGPNYVTDAACASSLAALQAAVEGLNAYHFDAVLTGGVDRNMGVESFVKFSKIGALSPDGSRPYAAGANGFVMGEGAAIFLLKRLEDAEKDGDTIYAVVRGIGSSSDGKGKGITAPNPVGQQRAVLRAWQNAGLDPATVGMIEGHGTSTRVGDVVEVNSLNKIFSASDLPAQSVALGSVKSNIGHLKSAAGAAGLLKVVLSLHHRQIPPSVNFERPNPQIPFHTTPFRVPTQLDAWEQLAEHPRRAALSSFGFGGTNFHVVVDEYVPGLAFSAPRLYPGAALSAAQPVPAPASMPVPTAAPSVDDAQVLQWVTALVAEKTGYPPEMLDSSLDLEADLGVDTVKQAELFAAVRSHYDIPRSDDLRLSDYNTLEKVAAFVTSHRPSQQAAVPTTALAETTSAAPIPTQPTSLNQDLLLLAAPTIEALQAQLEHTAAVWANGRPPQPDPVNPPQGHRLALMSDSTRPAETVKRLVKAQKALQNPSSAGWAALATQGIFYAAHEPGKTAFLFPGQGSQYADMLRDLCPVEPVIQHTFEEADAVMTPILGRPLTDFIFTRPDESDASRAEQELRNTAITQPAVLTANVALLRLLQQYGFAPDWVIGHSLGEYAALVAAEVLTFAEALEVVSARGREMSKVAMADNGCMAAVSGPIDEVQRLLQQVSGYVVIANLNSPVQSVIAGETAAVEAAITLFQSANIQAVKIPVSHAFHSKIVAPASEPLRQVISRMRLQSPRIPVVSNVTGQAYPAQPAAVLDLLAQQVAAPVQFIRGVQTLWDEGVRTFVEVGPKRVLTALLSDILKGRSGWLALSTNHPRKGGVLSFQEALCGLYAAGARPAAQAPAVVPAPQPQDSSPAVVPAPQPQIAATSSVPSFPRPSGSVVISGAGLGLPGRQVDMFAEDNIARILSGDNRIEPLPEATRAAMLQRRVTRLVKSESGAVMQTIDDLEQTVKLAGQRGHFDLEADFGIPADRTEATDISTQLAIAAGIEALRDAGIPLVMDYRETSKGTLLPHRWMLPEPLRDETGVIFGSAFPGLDRMAEETERFSQHQQILSRMAELQQLAQSLNGSAASPVAAEIQSRLKALQAQLDALDYHFDRRFIFRILSMGHAQFAETIGARGPNTHVNAACATTTHALAVAEDWIRTGRARRVIIISGDDVTSGALSHWVGTGLMASGAATTEGTLRLAALPFDRRRNGMIMGVAAAALVVEAQDALLERGMTGICELLATQIGNSAFHGTRLDVDHVSRVMENLLQQAEQRFNLSRSQIAPRALFMSHETYTPARGGSASAEIRALRRAFGPQANQILIANTKGFTGHTMGVGVEDVVAAKALELGQVPPIAHYDEEFQPDPELGDLNLSKGGSVPVEYALRLGAGFGSQIAMALFRKIPAPHGRKDPRRYQDWLQAVSGTAHPETEVVQHTLRIRHAGPPAQKPQPSTWRPGTVPTAWAEAPAAAIIDELPAQPEISEQPLPAPALASPIPEQDAASVLAFITQQVSEKTGYPAEMLDPDLDLEADLGIDTVKQAELFAAVRTHYNIPRREDLRLSEYNTLARVAGFVTSALGQPSQPSQPVFPLETPPTQAESQASPANTSLQAPPVQPSALQADAVKAFITQLVSEKTGYPPEMLDPDLDLEADLGIDTVKQAELFAAVRTHYNIPRREDLRLSDYNTLEKVQRFVLDQQAAPAAAQAEPEAAPAAPAEPSGAPILRRVPRAVLRPRLAVCAPTGVPWGAGVRVLILGAPKVAATLQRRLEAQQIQPILIPSGPAAQVQSALTQALESGPIQGVFCLSGLEPEPDVLESPSGAWYAAVEERVLALAAVMRALPPTAFLLTATHMGSLGGYGDSSPAAPGSGALIGFTKSLAWERPTALIKTVDFPKNARPVWMAERLIGECLADPSAVEIAWQDGQRFNISLIEAPADNPTLDLGTEPVFLISGGTAGIALPIVRDLASRVRGRFYLVGSRPLPVENDPDLLQLQSNRSQLLSQWHAQAASQGQRLSPAVLEARLAALERSAAALREIQQLQSRGVPVAYLSCDLTDPVQIAALVEQIQQREPQVDVFIHAAGTERSRKLESKPDTEIQQVLAVKLGGFAGLLRALHNANRWPKAVVSFSSIAGRFGNAGQTDYAAANDGLARLSAHLQGRFPAARWITIDWGAWAEVGMASRGNLPKLMEKAGIEMLQPTAAAPLVYREITTGSGEVILAGALGSLASPRATLESLDLEKANHALTSGQPIHIMLSRAAGMNLHEGLRLEAELDPNQEPFLKDHALNGIPLLPGVMGIEGFATAARHVATCLGSEQGEFRVAGLEDIQFLTPLKFYRSEKRRITWKAQVFHEKEGLEAQVSLHSTLALRSRQPEVVEHFKARVHLQPQGQPLPVPTIQPPHWNGAPKICTEDIYRLYFHGPAFQVLDCVQSAEGAVLGRLRTDLPAFTYTQQPLETAPILVELCLQTAGIYEAGLTGKLSLPSAIRRLKVYPQPGAAAEPLFARVVPNRLPDGGLSFQAWVTDPSGRVFLEMDGYRTAALPYSVSADLLAPLQAVIQRPSESDA